MKNTLLSKNPLQITNLIINLKCIIFDMDGTLTKGDNIDYIKMRQNAQIPFDVDILEYLQNLSGEQKSNAQFHIHQTEVEARQKSYLNDGCEETLKQLKKLDYKLAVLTRNSQSTMEWTLKQFNIGQYFDVTISRDFDGRPKPHPDGILYISQKLGLLAEECMMVGDSIDDINCGKNAQCLATCLINNQNQWNPDFHIIQLPEILKIIQ